MKGQRTLLIGPSQGLFLWVPLKDSSSGSLSLSRTSHGRGKLPHLFDNFMCVLFLLFFEEYKVPCVSLLRPFCAGAGEGVESRYILLVKRASLKLIVQCDNLPTKKILEICPFLLNFFHTNLLYESH